MKAAAVRRTVALIPIESIRANPFQPRKIFPESSIEELAGSIRLHGLLTPLLVRRVESEMYELIAGERRLRALKLLGRSHAEAVVVRAYDADCAVLALVENLQREDLHYLDEAEAFRSLLNLLGVTQEQLAETLSLSPSALANRLRLLKLSDEVRAALRRHSLSERHARALLRLSSAARQLQLIEECAQHRLSVRQLESRIAEILRNSPDRPLAGRAIRDNRIIINAVLDTVRELNRIGVHVESRVEEREDGVEVVVKIPKLSQTQKCAPP
ncbi:MAG: ParB/RepB/Spo0J family partition protein [Clostridia bacterium]|nr:ParB/RepB/Spo0J family partition protein [Clostridia bacterium]